MTDRNDDPGSPQATIERAKQGREILGSRVARGAPGEKQPAHDDPRLSASKTVEKLGEIVKQFEGETYGSSMERAKQPGNLNKVPPHERSADRGPAVLAAAATAAGAIGAARDAITMQLESDARLTSDPRYERDQKVFELGQAGKLGMVPPTEAEAAAAAARAGLPPEIGELTPKTPEEQVAQDMPRLQEAEERATTVTGTVIPAGEQDSAKKNNGLEAEAAGKTGEAAVQRAKASEQVEATQAVSPGRPTNVAQGTAPIASGSTASAPTGKPNDGSGTTIK